MEKTYAVINSDNLVVNTAVWDEVSEWNLPDGQTKRDVTGLGVGKGWTWVSGDTYTAPPDPVPTE